MNNIYINKPLNTPYVNFMKNYYTFNSKYITELKTRNLGLSTIKGGYKSNRKYSPILVYKKYKNLAMYRRSRNMLIDFNTVYKRFRQVKKIFKTLYQLNYKVKNFYFSLVQSVRRYTNIPYITQPFFFIKSIQQKTYTHSDKILLLNFLRYRFFPKIHDYKSNYQYVNLSLGMFSWRYKKKKSFKKNKLVYLLLANFVRKILLFSGILNYVLVVKKIPIYFKEILNTFLNPVIAPYEHPFEIDKIIEEKDIKNPFIFSWVIFYNNKPYGKLKLKKKGRLKRKISKKIVLLNRIID